MAVRREQEAEEEEEEEERSTSPLQAKICGFTLHVARHIKAHIKLSSHLLPALQLQHLRCVRNASDAQRESRVFGRFICVC
ncbi:hypothetical protein Q8A67_023175 [Cirrhinus molitorella]|uniref:Uncharacterized protein n=1 Tax=Cirrhinus molitorella TaxID=172907 RepID=A0AA88P725_9TELE|nr:hypothetical protein Q8A67_023175 [Cirrhinus molitorella]